MPLATNPETGEVVFLGQGGQWEPARTAVNPQTKEMLAFDGQGWSAVPVSKGIMTHIDDAVRSIASGVTFGWADEFSAKMNEFLGQGTYEDNVKKERQRDAQIPVAVSLPGEIAGAIGATILTAPLAAWRALAAVGSKVPQAVRYGAVGAGEGALAGAGGAEEGSRGTGALTGAAIGAPIGAVAPSVVRGVENTWNAVRGAVRPSSGAAADIGRAIVRDGTTPEALVASVTANQADRAGIATIADVGGENVRGLVERVAQTPGAGRTQVIPALTERQQAQAGRLTEDLRSLTGTTKTARQAIDETIEQRSAAAKPLYDEAFAFDARTSPEIVEAFKSAISTGFGREVMKSSALRNSLQTEYGVKNVMEAPLMVVIDAWKKQVDDLVGEATRKGKNNAARILSGMRDDVVSVVDKANPAYGQARNAWSGPSKYLASIENGRAILGRNVDADEFTARFAKLSDADKEAERIGAVSAIIAKMGNDGARMADMTKYLRSPEVRAKIAAIMPNEEAAAAWARRLDFEVGSSELAGRALGNSATARRLAEQNQAKGIVGDLVLDALMSGPASVSFLRSVLTAGPRWLRDTVRSRTDKELADILTNPDRVADLPAILRRASQQQRGTSSVSGVRPAAATASGVVTAE